MTLAKCPLIPLRGIERVLTDAREEFSRVDVGPSTTAMTLTAMTLTDMTLTNTPPELTHMTLNPEAMIQGAQP